jgi:hypothetical protein
MKPHRIIVPGKQKPPPVPTPIVMFAERVFDTDEQLTTTYKSDYIKIQRGKYIMHFF